MSNLSRRSFLRMAAGLGLTASGAMMLEKLALSTAFAQTQTDYKALVCIFFNGGNDSNNMIVPLTGATGFPAADVTGGYTAYNNERGGPGLAIPAPPATGAEAVNQLKRINPGAANPTLGTFGIHPNLDTSFASASPSVPAGTTVTINMPTVKTLYDAGRTAVVCNVGTLIQPTSKSQFGSLPRPANLYSHSDQISQNQTCLFSAAIPAGGAPPSSGWGGRMSDRTVFLNGSSTFPMQTSIAGGAQFMQGATQFPLVIAPAPTALNQILVLGGYPGGDPSTWPADERARRTALLNISGFNPPGVNRGANKLVDATSDVLNSALAVSAALSTDPIPSVPDPANPTVRLNLTFPNTGIGNQLRQVAKVIKANLLQPALALKRQVFFCSIGGYDTHQNQGVYNGTQGNLLNQVNQAVSTFYYWLQNNAPLTGEGTLGGDLTSKVTVFTLSDFNRTFNPAGSGAVVGSDHAWGSHFMALGGAVQGGRFYGLPLPGGNGSVFPTLTKGTASAYDVGSRGLWLPSVSTMQYANTLAAWFGLPQSDSAILDYVFPLLRTNFATTNLGFV